MAEVLTDSSRWTVSARSAGEVLAVRVGDDRLQVGFVGSPVGLQADEIRDWLSELIGMATATPDLSGRTPVLATPLPIPRSLHQALTGLLFLQSEVWGSPAGHIPLSLAVVRCDDRVAFGWSGSGSVTLAGPGEAPEPAWITVRDYEGREARALVVDGAAPLLVRGVWTAVGPGGEPLEGVLEAEWPGRGESAGEACAEPPAESGEREGEAPVPAGSEVRPEARPEVPGPGDEAAAPPEAWSPAGEAAARAETDAPAPASPRGPVAARKRPLWHFHGWMDEMADTPAPSEQDLSPERAAVPEVGMAEPGAWRAALEPIAHDVPGVPDLLPETEAATVTDRAEEVRGPDPLVLEAPMVEPLVDEPPAEERAPEAARPAEPAVPPGPGLEEEAPSPAAAEAAAPAVRARRLDWPEEAERRPRRRLHTRRNWTIVAVVLGLFAVGWLLGHVDLTAGRKAVGSALRAVGLGAAGYDVAVTSRPAGAWITVDGVDQARRTPATLTLDPGSHEITLSVSGEGGSTHPVSGKRGEHVVLDVALWGGLRIDAPAGSAPLTVTVDGMPHGYVPLELDRLQPGIHRLQFSGPGVAAWEQTVEVHVNRTAEVLAQPVVAPPTGVLEVRARLADETGSEPLAGAAVRIDGVYRGVTPLRLELPRGPHSIRVAYGGEDSPVQVIELPGGNQRFATLDVGLAADLPRLTAALPGRVPIEEATVLSARLERARVGDAREMWLHVRTPEGAWRRYPMEMMKASGGLVGVAVFPTDVFDRNGRTSWYVSALAPTGDEYFTEIQPGQAASR